jgi:hypothetical protein
MRIQQAIARAVLERVVGRLDVYPEEVYQTAMNALVIMREREKDGSVVDWPEISGSWYDFKEALEKHPECMSEIGKD